MSKIALTEDYEAIGKYFNNEIDKLTERQFKLFERLDMADNLIRVYGSDKEAVAKLYNRMKLKEASYSLRQARRDIQMSIQFYGSRGKFTKEMDRLQAKHELMKEIKFLQKNITDPFKRAMAYAKLRKELRETQNYHLEDPDLPNFSEIGANVVLVVTDPEKVNLKPFTNEEKARIERKYAVKPNLEGSEEVEDIDHEELD